MSVNTIEQLIKEIAAQTVDERLAQFESLPKPVTAVDEATQKQINTYELLSRKPYLTRKEAALYLDVSERSIEDWSKRPFDQNPFPETYAGGLPRYKRQDIDKWISRERGRVRLKAI